MKRGHVTGRKHERTPANDWYQSAEAEAIMQALEAAQTEEETLTIDLDPDMLTEER